MIDVVHLQLNDIVENCRRPRSTNCGFIQGCLWNTVLGILGTNSLSFVNNLNVVTVRTGDVVKSFSSFKPELPELQIWVGGSSVSELAIEFV